MLLDNKQHENKENSQCVSHYLSKNIGEGDLKVVTGYFTINALSYFYEQVNKPKSINMILGELVVKEDKKNKIVDLLRENLDISDALKLKSKSEDAIKFINQAKVELRQPPSQFCHAKTFVYDDAEPKNKFYIIGSSNLTEAGIGLRPSSNIELNTAITGGDADYEKVERWFDNLWSNSKEDIELGDKNSKNIKEYIIEQIESYFKEYDPKKLYYKVLFECFKNDLYNGFSESKEIKLIEHTTLYKTLFPYQQKAVITLIKMLEKYNGAILADAVGLGKTWTALAVMKYYQNMGYRVVLFCPKKLRGNWVQYIKGNKSKFDNDHLDYLVRFHTDLQNERLSNNNYNHKIHALQNNERILFVIDESHNLRNDKSSRYKFLVENLLEKNRGDVKVLQLSATPINNKLDDLRNQFKLIVKGREDGFKNTDLKIPNLTYLFSNAQKVYSNWQALENRTIRDFVSQLDNRFFDLTDALIVARTRSMIEKEDSTIKFPKKQKPISIGVELDYIGEYKNFDGILEACKISFIAYRPSEYTENAKAESAISDQVQREYFLAKMMYILLVKRLESCWNAFDITIGNMLNYFKSVLDKVDKYLNYNTEAKLDYTESAEMDDLEDLAADLEVEIGKKNPIGISTITKLDKFREGIKQDIDAFESLKKSLDKMRANVKCDYREDKKLARLIDFIEQKQKSKKNKKVIIFTTYKDTAQYLFEKLADRFKAVAYITGDSFATSDGFKGNSFEPLLERFAPYSKLFKEKDWTLLYREKGVEPIEDFDAWKEFIEKHDPECAKKLHNPIDILIASDVLSEGQNLQDSDCIVNYDIHWNPVRLLQRFGRIDRIGSPNDEIMGVNFWPEKNCEDYIKLNHRVVNRLSLMKLVGTEVDPNIDEKLESIIKDNPLASKQEELMLKQLEQSWEEVEQRSETLALYNLSMESFRHELFDVLKEHAAEYDAIPNGVFTGFRANPNPEYPSLPKGVIAALGCPKRKKNGAHHDYKEIHLLYADENGAQVHLNKRDILSILRNHKEEDRFVSEDIDNGKKEELEKLAALIKNWIAGKTPKKAAENVIQVMDFGAETNKAQKNQPKIEEQFIPENFDLITWFVVSNGKDAD
ncbi:MAG: helicase-related protein [Chloroflexota bacterium]